MPRFMAFSAGPSSGQDFRRMGVQGNTFAFAAASIEAMSARFQFIGIDAARIGADILEEEIVKYVDETADFKYSEGRLAATIGTWKPDMIRDPDVLTQAMEWAKRAGVNQSPIHTRDVEETLEYGALRSIRHVRGNIYSAEVGTFTPYAGLVEDGGSMDIHPYNDPNRTVTATWTPHNMFSKGAFDAQQRIEVELEGLVKRYL
jgi:hypothetical protein